MIASHLQIPASTTPLFAVPNSDIFKPFATLEQAYGKDLEKLTTEVCVLSIVLLGYSITNDGLEIYSFINCGAYYDRVKKFPVLVEVLTSELSENEKLNLLALIARCI